MCMEDPAYTGKKDGAKRVVNQGSKVVQKIKTSGSCITCDSFFTSAPLACELLKKLTRIGTVLITNQTCLRNSLLLKDFG